MRTLNLGILAHVDAGKTSLTERLLFEAGAIAELGSVDAGTTRTDSMDIERRRGITVRTNVASFAAADVQVNLIDTPGHSDFIAEVERSLAVLDAAVLVVSAVEGVQPQTVVLWRVLRRLAVPAAVFINKIDRQGADPVRVRAGIGRRLAAGSGARLLSVTDVLAAGSPGAATRPVPLTDPSVIDVLTSGDDRLLRAALDGPRVTEAMALRSARAQVGRGAVVPVAAGSALTGAGVPDLLTTLPRLLPWARPAARSLSAVIYKIEHGAPGDPSQRTRRCDGDDGPPVRSHHRHQPRRREPGAHRHAPHPVRSGPAGAASRADQRRGSLYLGGNPLHAGQGLAPGPHQNRPQPPGPTRVVPRPPPLTCGRVDRRRQPPPVRPGGAGGLRGPGEWRV